MSFTGNIIPVYSEFFSLIRLLGNTEIMVSPCNYLSTVFLLHWTGGRGKWSEEGHGHRKSVRERKRDRRGIGICDLGGANCEEERAPENVQHLITTESFGNRIVPCLVGPARESPARLVMQ